MYEHPKFKYNTRSAIIQNVEMKNNISI
jgi:hypothetical protein